MPLFLGLKKSIQLESLENDYLIPKKENFQNNAIDRMSGHSGKRILEKGVEGLETKNTKNPCTWDFRR